MNGSSTHPEPLCSLSLSRFTLIACSISSLSLSFSSTRCHFRFASNLLVLCRFLTRFRDVYRPLKIPPWRSFPSLSVKKGSPSSLPMHLPHVLLRSPSFSLHLVQCKPVSGARKRMLASAHDATLRPQIAQKLRRRPCALPVHLLFAMRLRTVASFQHYSSGFFFKSVYADWLPYSVSLILAANSH